MTAWPLAVTAAVAVAAAVQAVSGSGFGLLAAPLLLVVAPELVPGPLLLATVLVMALTLWRDRRGLRRPDLVPAAAAGAVGASAAVPLAPVLQGPWLAPGLGTAVVVAGVAALRGWRLRGSPPVLATAGAVGGCLATIAAMPGPPVVVAYRAEDPVRMRANLALFFLVTSLCSVAVLAAAGGLGHGDLHRAALLLPGLLGGLGLGVVLRRRLPARWARPLGLWLVVGAGALLLVRSLPA